MQKFVRFMVDLIPVEHVNIRSINHPAGYVIHAEVPHREFVQPLFFMGHDNPDFNEADLDLLVDYIHGRIRWSKKPIIDVNDLKIQ